MENNYELYELWQIGCEELETYVETIDETEMVEFEQGVER